MPNTLEAAARSFLFVPGNRPDRYGSAAASGADVVIIDLEDAVPLAEKDTARQAAIQYLSANSAAVRINAASTEWHEQELAAIMSCAGLRAVVVPKAVGHDTVATAIAALDGRVPIFALIETAARILASSQLARTSGIARLMFGSLDYSLDVGALEPSEDQSELLLPRSELVIASAAAGLPGPVDGVHPTVNDAQGLTASAEHARMLGFTGKLCIHPTQVAAVNQAFTPTAALISWADRVAEAHRSSGGGVILMDGEMLDRPQFDRARLILERSQWGKP